jgi:hypothetical protein
MGTKLTGTSLYEAANERISFEGRLLLNLPFTMTDVPVQSASAFMIDLSQVSLALRGATERSLLILDEFGKGQLIDLSQVLGTEIPFL